MKTFLLSAALLGAAAIFSSCGGTTNTCNANNCAGCCSGDVCNSGTATSACGKGGVACLACTGTTVCSSAQVCGFDGTTKWRVQPVSATVKNNNNGSKWDTDDSAADPYVELYCPGNATDKTASTAVVSDSYSPTWSGDGCIMTGDALISGGFAYQVIDSDVIGGDSITAKISVPVKEADLTAGAAAVSPTDGLTALSIALQKQ